MKKILFLLLLLISLTGFGQTTYYVSTAANGGSDANDGSVGSPWLTVDYAATQVTTPGDIIYITAGSYTEPNRIELSPGVSILGTGDASHIISTYHPETTYGWDGSIYVRSESKTTGNQSISYIKLSGSDTTAWYGIYVGNRHGIKIHHCTIKDFKYRGVKYGGDADTSGEYITGSEVYNCIITNSADRTSGGNLHFEGQDGMLIHDNIFSCIGRAAGDNGNIITTGDGWNKGVKYYNNKSYTLESNGSEWNFHIEHWDSRGGIEIYDNEFYGGGCYIDCGGYTNSKGTYDYSFYIHNNIFERASTQPYNVGRENDAIIIEGASSDIIITKNHFKYQQFGVKFSPGESDRTIERIYIHYNIFENIGLTNNNWSAGIVMVVPTNDIIDSIFVQNNVMTASSFAASGTGGGGLFQFSGSATQTISNIFFKNNIIKGFTIGPYWVYTNTVITSLTNSNNIVYLNGNSNDIRLYSGASVTSYTVADTLKRDPVFISTSNFRLQASSPAINAGTDVSLTSDYDGNTVPVGSFPDIGAFEYLTLPVSVTGLGWEPKLHKFNFKDDINIAGRWMIDGVPVSPSATTINRLEGFGGNASQLNHVTSLFVAGDTTVTAVVGKIVYQAADSSFYGCRSTVANRKWYKLHD
jgi:hypothetical protein